jgi:alpha-1,3-rhamnosyltransferase
MENNTPLVSIIIVSYNCADYILETLESARTQTYQNIEIIVTDDGSQDNTLEIVETWMRNNSNRFKRSVIVRSEINTGTPKNCNRGLRASEGAWIKLVAGDDILMPHCVETMLRFSLSQKSLITTSDMIEFCDDNLPKRLSKSISLEQMRFFKLRKDKQFQSYLRNPVFLNSPALFINKELFERVGYFDEAFKILEDTPFILKTLRAGYNIYYNENQTIKYRTNQKAVERLDGQISDTLLCFTKYRLKYFSRYNIYDNLIRYNFFLFSRRRKSNNPLSRFLWEYLTKFTDFLYIRKKIAEKIFDH